ncbi:MAG TPA: tetratricopeptide repeat protein, partial [Pirellulaceae bacterium]
MFDAWQKYQGGHFDAAEIVCQRVLAANQNDANALHLLGLIALQMGQAETAKNSINQAMAIQWTQAAPHFELGNALKNHKQLEDAA